MIEIPIDDEEECKTACELLFRIVNGDNEYMPLHANFIVISDNKEDMIREFETLVSVSQQHIDNIEYDKLVVESKDSILSILNPQFAKEKEQEVRFTSLESRVGGVEKGINDIKSLLVEALNKKG